MSKKWWFIVGVVFIIAILLGIAIVVSLPPTPGITYANYSRIEKGMTREHVGTLLGQPELRLVPIRVDQENLFMLANLWRSDKGDSVHVAFDGADRVRSTGWNYVEDNRDTLEKLRDRLPLIAREPPPPWPLKIK